MWFDAIQWKHLIAFKTQSPGIGGCISLRWWPSGSHLSRMWQCDGFTTPRQLEVLNSCVINFCTVTVLSQTFNSYASFITSNSGKILGWRKCASQIMTGAVGLFQHFANGVISLVMLEVFCLFQGGFFVSFLLSTEDEGSCCWAAGRVLPNLQFIFCCSAFISLLIIQDYVVTTAKQHVLYDYIIIPDLCSKDNFEASH